MGKSIVHLEEERKWEGAIFHQVCQLGQREAEAYLEGLDDALFEQRPTSWEVVFMDLSLTNLGFSTSAT